MLEYQGVFVHHGASPSNPPDPHSTWRGYQNYHMNSHGWSDIGYSWGVTYDGEILEGRGWGIWGTHTINYNSKAHAVCYVGNGNDHVPEAALQAIVTVCNEHDQRYGPGYRKAHGDVNSTSCPGQFLTAWVHEGLPTATPPPNSPPEEETMRIIYAKKPGGGWTPNAIWNGGGTRERVEDPALVALFGPNWASLPIRSEVDYEWYIGLQPVGSENVWA